MMKHVDEMLHTQHFGFVEYFEIKIMLVKMYILSIIYYQELMLLFEDLHIIWQCYVLHTIPTLTCIVVVSFRYAIHEI